MMIDEAIARAKERADKNSECWKNCIASGYCEKCEKEHEQLAEWLEELKRYKGSFDSMLQYVTNKAIDETISRLKQVTNEDIIVIAKDNLDDIARELKEQK